MERKCDDVGDRSANNPSILIALDQLAEGFPLVGDRTHIGEKQGLSVGGPARAMAGPIAPTNGPRSPQATCRESRCRGDRR